MPGFRTLASLLAGPLCSLVLCAANPGPDHAPLHFEPNTGQFDSQVKYVSRGNGYTLFLTDTSAVVAPKL